MSRDDGRWHGGGDSGTVTGGKEPGTEPGPPPNFLRVWSAGLRLRHHLHHSVTALFGVLVGTSAEGIPMTIYSQHPNRGKVQVLAAYRASAGVVSSTVTSVEDTTTATRLVDALNRISACATVPLSVWDRRERRIERYPREHLTVLTDRDARPALLEGNHSLWYEHVKLLLHRALTDLDRAVASLPAPVRTAITAELEKEARDLHHALAEYTDAVERPAEEDLRTWDSSLPFVLFEGGLADLGDDARSSLDRLEKGMSETALAESVAGMRLLIDAHTRCANPEAWLVMEELNITDDPDPFGPGRYFLDVQAPLPDGEHYRDCWTVDLGWWELDPADPHSARGDQILQCTRPTPPPSRRSSSSSTSAAGTRNSFGPGPRHPSGPNWPARRSW